LIRSLSARAVLLVCVSSARSSCLETNYLARLSGVWMSFPSKEQRAMSLPSRRRSASYKKEKPWVYFLKGAVRRVLIERVRAWGFFFRK